jgi:hypothetical protein
MQSIVGWFKHLFARKITETDHNETEWARTRAEIQSEIRLRQDISDLRKEMEWKYESKTGLNTKQTIVRLNNALSALAEHLGLEINVAPNDICTVRKIARIKTKKGK